MQENPANNPAPVLESGTYEIIRQRLQQQGIQLKEKLDRLNTDRKAVFGALTSALASTDRITTAHNCVPRDMVAVGEKRFLFGYNVFLGLKNQTQVSDVFAVYEQRDHTFHQLSLDLLGDAKFQDDFKELYKYYKQTRFAKFSLIGPHLFMVFQIGRDTRDIKTFKWLLDGNRLVYQGNRSEHNFKYPPQHEFEWTRTHRDLHRAGRHPHISILDRVFVETIEGDLTVKIEDNTETGAGIYSEPVDQKDQTLDDAEIFYASLGNLILLKIRPYQENDFRYFVFNDKLKVVHRLDSIRDACVLLPENHGIIFSNGYYLQLGDLKKFPHNFADMVFERRVASPNGEDHLFVFYNEAEGAYILMSYNLIEQKVESPVICHGFSLFDNGEMMLFKAHEEPQKHHTIQIWQTPYINGDLILPEKTDSLLYKVGNPSIVGCISECQEVLSLLNKEDTYAGLYVDLVKAANDIIDSYFWLDRPEAMDLRATLAAIKESAAAAVDEFEKVLRIKRHSQSEFNRVSAKAKTELNEIEYAQLDTIEQYVTHLAALRAVRGELITLKALRYVELPAIENLEKQVAQLQETLARRCVDFLLQPSSLQPYQKRVQEHAARVESLAKVAEVKKEENALAETASALEMLIDIVSNLKIEDTTQATRIIDAITGIFAPLNQVKAALQRRRAALQRVEGAAQLSAQMRLLDQSVVNYLEVSETPESCDEYRNKVLVQMEEMESQFADLEEFQTQLAEKREELYAAFENRKVTLLELRQKKASALMVAAERVLKGIQHRAGRLGTMEELQGYFASDLMVQRVRDLIAQLEGLEDPVRAGDLQTRLKTVREDASRQLKDRLELFVDGQNIIQLGAHKFAVNTREVELTMLPRDGEMHLHLTSTNFFERVADADFEQTRAVWDQEFVSENRAVYRAEYLAWKFLQALASGTSNGHEAQTLNLDQFLNLAEAERLAAVQQFMAPRYAEGYIKGLHDVDAVKILTVLGPVHRQLGLLIYPPVARACGALFWRLHLQRDALCAAKYSGLRLRNELFQQAALGPEYARELRELLAGFCRSTGLFPESLAAEAGAFLVQSLTSQTFFPISEPAVKLYQALEEHLRESHYQGKLETARKAVEADVPALYQLLREWVAAYATATGQSSEVVDEAALLLLDRKFDPAHVVTVPVHAEIPGMAGSHPVLPNQTYHFHYHQFQARLRRHEEETVPLFQRYLQLKTALLQRARAELRLGEFQSRVLTSFVRNRLIDTVYLPLIGANMAKQIGVAGETTRTDRMGLLLLVSPPGYGKTTLMEYIANRLGLVFIKINGPAIGAQITSLDPAEARHASARQELEKINLALEMGDNVMLYLDDIQHCHPELLQKFISLCDAQRRIEGIYKGRARTYDLRGKKVAVVMAGNPYTESGEIFQIPDMLANRADTYNLGDIIASADEAFKSSYLENAITSNPVLNSLASRGRQDIHALIRLAQGATRDGVQMEGSYSVEELNEYVSVLRKLIRVREIVLRVNQEYIRSAAQADAYRTEPAFRLQGSYRNMNRLAERVLPIMNDAEVDALIQDHYQNEAQTLARDAEASLLKFKEIIGWITPAEVTRWEHIKRTCRRNLLFEAAGTQDPVGRVVAQLAAFGEGLDAIKSVLTQGVQKTVAATAQPERVETLAQIALQLPRLNATLDALRKDFLTATPKTAGAEPAKPGATKADYEITSVNSDTLKKIWALIEEDRRAGGGPDSLATPK